MDKFKRIVNANKLALEDLGEDEGMIICMYYAKGADTKMYYARRNAGIFELCYLNSVINKIVKDVLDEQDLNN